ncbi:GNAT family N-acetyltransferase [Entomomonas sp. E2T0]|uniref:GNAT family N-acetyltransferase n=1 Tax=Entomomonas sp. E2T0 TaxID=2930213 RepID=UPI00222840D2|nr:GNAT family N-acetyltransferase [Entomomonas sp. E2T0]UYZ83583.1 GNAT family N-acetyltransferase [Entomomonas sp. E2T0]
MPDMIDVNAILIQFQEALLENKIELFPSEKYPNLYMMLDDADGNSRMTYAFIEKDLKVKAIAIYLHMEPIGYTTCVGVSYAVAEDFRNQGIAKLILEQSISDLTDKMPEYINEIYIEAIVGISNIPSQKVAEKVLSSTPKKTVDAFSNQDAYQYVRLVKK